MAETQKTINVTPVIDQQALRELAAHLEATLTGAAKVLQASMRRSAEEHEVGVLFALYRQMRRATEPELSAELDARWKAAIDGYDTAYLADLITFGERLAETARPVWAERGAVSPQ